MIRLTVSKEKNDGADNRSILDESQEDLSPQGRSADAIKVKYGQKPSMVDFKSVQLTFSNSLLQCLKVHFISSIQSNFRLGCFNDYSIV